MRSRVEDEIGPDDEILLMVESTEADDIERAINVRTNESDNERDPNKGAWIRWGERIDAPATVERHEGGIRILAGRTYLRRWVLEARLFTLRVHHFTCSDDARHFHDHPWWFITLVLKGGYTDVSPAGRDHLGRGSIRFRRAQHRHTVEIDEDGVWTFVISGRKTRPWGFWIKDKWMKANQYFFEHGHHPCD